MVSYSNYKCIKCGVQTSAGTWLCRLCREEHKMGYVPVKPKKDFKRPQLMEDENVY